MSGRWAIRLPLASAVAAAPLRHRAVEAHRVGDDLWLRGTGDDHDPLVRRIPAVARFVLADDDSLTPLGKRLPVGKLPAGPWAKLESVVALHPQPAGLPAALKQRSTLSIARAGHETAPDAMLVPLPAWVRHAVFAPQVRLDRLRFAVRSDGTALLLGTPLPPLPGSYLVDHDGILIPAGWELKPRLQPVLVRRVLNLSDGDLALFDTAGGYEVVNAESVLPATRAAARRTAAAFAEGGPS